METKIKRMLRKAKEFNKIAEIDEIARRYFALNSFDGVLTTLGIMLANFFAGIRTNSVIIISCLGAAIAVAISGFYGAYATERSERTGALKKLEKKIGFSLRKTAIEKAHFYAIFVLALIEGFSPFLIALSMIIPFFIAKDIMVAYFTSFAIAMVLLFLLGIFLGKISKENLFNSGAKMLIAGAICTVILYIVEKLLNI